MDSPEIAFWLVDLTSIDDNF